MENTCPARAPKNAHNYFIQFASDVGIPTLFLLLVVILLAFRQAFKMHPNTGDENSLRKGLMVGVGGYLLTCLLGHPLLLSNQQLLFWFAVAGMSFIAEPKGISGGGFLDSRRARMMVAAVLGAVLLAGYGYKWVTFREWRGYEFGFYPYEQWDAGQMMFGSLNRISEKLP